MRGWKTMRRSTMSLPAVGLLIISGGVMASTPDQNAPVVGIAPAIIEMDFPEALGAMQRPPVEFNHAAHTTALKVEGCAACHTLDEAGFHPGFAATAGLDDRNELTDAYHDTCIGCHDERLDSGVAGGPVTCGNCHKKTKPGVSLWVAINFDYSLHARHVKVYPEECGTCHHVWDKEAEKLKYEKGKEDACGACHLKVAVERTPSLVNASHRACLSCHLERVKHGSEAGPVLCEGCHDATHLASLKKLEAPPRLMAGQPDSTWIKAPGGMMPLVAFNHEAHEPQANFCTTCHHSRLRSCADCHTQMSSPDGGGVSLEAAHHETGSMHSCIGCHQMAATTGDCVGCHSQTIVAGFSRSCAKCHDGPLPFAGEPPVLERGSPAPVKLAELPSASDDLPEEVTIDVLVDHFAASKMPHRKIIARFDAKIRESTLATQFHGSVEAMCAGCHHHSPVGERPPRCRACHGDLGAATIDRPPLKVAYHRQCVSCHQMLGLKHGCTDCHAAKEEQS